MRMYVVCVHVGGFRGGENQVGLIDLQENISIEKIKILFSTLKTRWVCSPSTPPFLPPMCGCAHMCMCMSVCSLRRGLASIFLSAPMYTKASFA